MLCCGRSRSHDGRPLRVDETRFLRAVARTIEGAILHFSRAVGILLINAAGFAKRDACQGFLVRSIETWQAPSIIRFTKDSNAEGRT
jgi:hypothetical protein